jgi:dTMP kinase
MTAFLPKGFFIVMEGIDGTGKSTQVKAVAAALRERGFEVVTTKEPTDGPWGKILRNSGNTGRLSPQEELETFIKDRKEHVETLIRPSLAAGKVVITDRYYFSTAAYQGARGLDPQEIIRRNEEFAPEADLLVVLDADPSVGIGRVEGRGDKANLFETNSGLTKAREIFQQIKKPYLVRIDARQEPAKITSRILEEFSKRTPK